MLDDGDGVCAFVAHIVVMDEVFAVAERFNLFDFMNAFAILGVAAEFPDGVAATIAELVVVRF